SLLPNPSGSSGTGSVGGAVTGPDVNTLPEPDSLPPWPQVAMSGSRKASPISIKIKFTGKKSDGDSLNFPSLITCSQGLGPHSCPNIAFPKWDWSFEVS